MLYDEPAAYSSISAILRYQRGYSPQVAVLTASFIGQRRASCPLPQISLVCQVLNLCEFARIILYVHEIVKQELIVEAM